MVRTRRKGFKLAKGAPSTLRTFDPPSFTWGHQARGAISFKLESMDTAGEEFCFATIGMHENKIEIDVDEALVRRLLTMQTADLAEVVSPLDFAHRGRPGRQQNRARPLQGYNQVEPLRAINALAT